MSRKKAKNKANINKFTELDIDNLITNAFPFHIIMLAEAVIGYFMQDQLNRLATKVEKFAVYHSQIYFEHSHITLYKLLLDKSGKDSLSIEKLLSVIINSNYKPEYKSEIENLRVDFNAEILQKYKEILDVIKIFRTSMHAHILAIPIENKPELKQKSYDAAIDFVPLVKDTISFYIRLLNIYNYQHELSEYEDLDKLIKDRIFKILPKN